MREKSSYEINMNNGHKNTAFETEGIGNGKYKSSSTLTLQAENGVQITEKLPEKKNKTNEDSEKKKNGTLVSVIALFRFAKPIDWIMMAIGTAGALAAGASFPVMMLIFTGIIDTFTGYGSSFCSLNLNLNATNTTTVVTIPNLGENLKSQIIWMIVLAIIQMVVSYFRVAFWLMPAERQTNAIRTMLFRSILRQEIGWFDVYKSGELNSRITEDVNQIKEGISDKFSSFIQYFATFIAGIIIGFVRGWKLTLVILSLSPVMFIAAALFTKLVGFLTANELKSYAKSGAVAEEVFTAIRTVFAFNGAQKEHKRFEKNLEDARKSGIKKAIVTGFLLGFLWIVINCAYALGFWYGWTLTIDANEGYSVGKILLVFFSIIIAVFSLGNAAPFLQTLTTARAAAYEVFQIIDRKSQINAESEEGVQPKELIGEIEFKNVDFKYPAREEVQVLNNFNLNVKPGQTVALVGKSGCGKSTCIQLLQRFYDPLSGLVKIDGNDLKDINLHWLRTHIGVVNQEPILFATSIADNIRMGRDGVTQQEIEQAAMNANAHDFIMTLPDGYNTLVGNRGSQLSGGQKQRIAIARALVRNPRILLLDEATSALDNESESIVQAALDRARLGRTTIIVAHRLSTIRNADIIFAMKDGQVLEIGTHDQLMSKQGLYHSLVITQSAGIEEKRKPKPNEVKELITKSKESKLDESVKKEEGEKKEKVKDVSMLRVFALNKPEWYIIIVGCFASIISGAVQPAFSIVFSKILAVFSKCDIEEQRRDITLYCILFICFGITTLLSNILKSSMFGISGENLTKRLRSQGFKAMLSQDIAWFDDPANNIGTLCTKLSTEAAAVQGATGAQIGNVLMNVGNFGVGLLLAMIYGWAIALTILAFVPLLIVGGIFQTKVMTGFSSKDKKVLEDVGEITNQAISNIRTVAILNKEKYFYDEYSKKLDVPYKASMRSSNIYALIFGFTSSITFFATAAAFSLGAYLIENNLFGMTFENIMLVFSCIIFGAQSVGQASSYAPDYAKAKTAAAHMFDLFDRKPSINNWESESKEKVDEKKFEPTIVFDSIEFNYPSRPDAPVLQNLSLTVKQGQRIALVGSSGCGKSTVTQLLERFYDVDKGQVKISNLDVKNADLFWLRSQMSIVSQEPILFDGTIAENIAYGDNSREVPINEIVEAAKKANIHSFVISLPDGYETNCGSKGTQLSGGQKQRIAIARALVRNPKILLLDEATSALDTDSEKIVQEALDKAQQGRTCIIIAHRLTTIKNADVIYVIKEGKVIEHGSHNELISLNGFYSKLYNTS